MRASVLAEKKDMEEERESLRAARARLAQRQREQEQIDELEREVSQGRKKIRDLERQQQEFDLMQGQLNTSRQLIQDLQRRYDDLRYERNPQPTTTSGSKILIVVVFQLFSSICATLLDKSSNSNFHIFKKFSSQQLFSHLLPNPVALDKVLKLPLPPQTLNVRLLFLNVNILLLISFSFSCEWTYCLKKVAFCFFSFHRSYIGNFLYFSWKNIRTEEDKSPSTIRQPWFGAPQHLTPQLRRP